MKPLFCLLALAGLTGPSLGQAPLQETPWTYANQDDWVSDGYSVCAKSRNSPIEFITGEQQSHPPVKGPLIFLNHCDDVPGTFINDGHNLHFEPNEGHEVVIEKGTLPVGSNNDFKWNFTRMTLHWGQNDTLGSNHVIDGKRYAGEMTLLFKNTRFTEVESLGKLQGNAAISLLIETKPHAYNEGFEPILMAAEALADSGSNTTVGAINIETILKTLGYKYPTIFDFFQYRGSQMFPKCSQSYAYIVPTRPITVSPCQLNALRKLKFEDGSCMYNNYRELNEAYVGRGTPPNTDTYNLITAAELESAK